MAKKDIGPRAKKSDFSAWFSEIIARAELADMRHNVKGFLVHRPLSVIAMKEMYRLYEKELEGSGHEPVLFPAVIPHENFELEKEHVKGFSPEVFWITETGDGSRMGEKLALRPTSETSMYKMYSVWVRSYRDLPLKLYQSCQVWRYETKATRPFIRGREFYWIEAHDAFATKKEAEKQVKEDMDMTENIMHKEFGVPFMFFRRPEWDRFPGAVYTYAADTLMPDGKILQQPSTHFLGQNFSMAFGVKFKDRKGEEQYAWQTCYGPAIWRIFASVIAIHGDDRGLVFPFKIAPVQVIIVPISLGKKVIEKCKEIEKKLKEQFRVKTDVSENTPGWKFNQWEMKGVPLRIEVGPKEIMEKRLTTVRRDNGQKQKVMERDIGMHVDNIGEDLTRNLIEKADRWFESNIGEAKHFRELEKSADKGGFIKTYFCSIGKPGQQCGEKLKEKLHLHVRGERPDRREKPSGNCVVCGKKAGVVVYVGRQY